MLPKPPGQFPSAFFTKSLLKDNETSSQSLFCSLHPFSDVILIYLQGTTRQYALRTPSEGVQLKIFSSKFNHRKVSCCTCMFNNMFRSKDTQRRSVITFGSLLNSIIYNCFSNKQMAYNTPRSKDTQRRSVIKLWIPVKFSHVQLIQFQTDVRQYTSL